MAVYDDYRNSLWRNYFTDLFRLNHLRPFVPVPLGGHQEARQRARAGNLSLIVRARAGHGAAWNSVIYDFDTERRVRQVLQLMQEVEERNAKGYYQSHPELVTTLQTYCIHTTGHGSRQELLRRPFQYGVAALNGRYLIHHFAGPLG